jgi:DegV family protein with EDD domain
MPVKVITDSTADIKPEAAKELNIGVLPIYINFGDEVYRDGVDIQNEEFYRMLTNHPVHPSTSQPNPQDFVNLYSEHINDNDAIVSIHISSKISGTYNSAKIAKQMMNNPSSVEVIDSKFNSGGLGLVVKAAARLAQNGVGLNEITREVYSVIDNVRMFGLFQTMKYLSRSGRVNKMIASVARILHVMPLLTFNDGEVARAGLVRKVQKGIDRICEFVKNNAPITELTIVHSQVQEQAESLKKLLSEFITEERIEIEELGAGLGAHGGPGVLLVALKKLT